MRSLKTRLGIGAALLGLGTLATAAILWLGMNAVAARLDTALASEARMSRYATLSQQTSTFLVVATEAIQTGQSAETRIARVTPVTDQIANTFTQLHKGVEAAVREAETLGLNEQSRYGTQSLGLARMEALLQSALRGINTDTDDRTRLRAHIDTFASNFDPLLSQAVNTEVLFRNATLEGINALRRTLILAALAIAALTILAVAAFYFGLIRPQFRRLDALRAAAHRIGDEDFAVALPATRNDEIGQLYSETNRMAAALATRQSAVEAEWSRLNETIAERTEALREANDRLAETDENRRRFFADVSHELRTPLTVILMEAQIGKQAGGPEAEAFTTIEARAARLNRRIDDLLRVARSETGELALDMAPTRLPDLIEETITEVDAEVDNAGMSLTSTAPPDITFPCDANWMRQTIASLIRNAIRHARTGGAVALAATADATSVTLTITDNGPGIAPRENPRVLERFGQSGSSKAQGFGVGLSLAKWITEQHGGRFTLTSPAPDPLADNPGLAVTLVLPREAP